MVHWLRHVQFYSPWFHFGKKKKTLTFFSYAQKSETFHLRPQVSEYQGIHFEGTSRINPLMHRAFVQKDGPPLQMTSRETSAQQVSKDSFCK